MNIPKPFFLSRSFNINLHRNSFTKSSPIPTQTMFAFATLTNVVSNTEKIVNLLSSEKLIKVWPLEDLFRQAVEKNEYNKNKDKLKTERILESKLEDLFYKISQESNDSLNVVINNYFSSIQKLSLEHFPTKEQEEEKALYNKLIDFINKSENWSFVPHHINIVNRQRHSSKNELKLLIGDYNESIIKHFSPNSYITLEELCAMYPEKVPLSYRKREPIESIREIISTRLSQGRQEKISLKEEPRFNEIIIINNRIKMWDEAYQIMLDELPIKITVPFHLIEPSEKFHKLNLHNFLEGFKACHRIIHPEIPLEIEQQNIEQFLSEYLTAIANDLPSKHPKIEVEIMDKSLNAYDKKRFELLL